MLFAKYLVCSCKKHCIYKKIKKMRKKPYYCQKRYRIRDIMGELHSLVV